MSSKEGGLTLPLRHYIIDAFKNVTDKLMGRTDKPMGRQPGKVFFKLRTGPERSRHFSTVHKKSGKVQTFQEK